MALPVGQISLSEVNTELGISPASTLITMNDAAVRTLAGVGGSGTVISMSNLQGKSNVVSIPLTIAAPAYNYDVYTNRGPTYSPGNSNITVTINPGVTVGSTSTSTFALTVPSAFSPTDNITIVNNGTIVGRGGNGGAGSPANFPSNATAGGAGGTALRILRPTTITNNGTIGGGGGGGGGGGRGGPSRVNGPEGSIDVAEGRAGAGGVGGGGAGFDAGSPNGSATAGGGGGGGGTATPTQFGSNTGGTGGAGGARGAAGSSGNGGTFSPAGLPVNNNLSNPGAGGGAAGAYISGLPFATFPATGTRLGPSS
jgi:hypothetical protein